MYKIKTLNKISPIGLKEFPKETYKIEEDLSDPDAIIVRSFKMHDLELPDSLKAIARAGAGTNNIPVDKCSKQGIVVFNTPGANANSVKELVLAGLLISSRRIFGGMEWVKSISDKGDEIPKLVEKGKSDFTGQEIKGKKLGVIGLGSIGVMVANDAAALGMKVSGFDPFITVDSAWGLSRAVKKAKSLDYLISNADYLTIHIPLTEETKEFFDARRFSIMKKGVKILNFSRGGLISNSDLKDAFDKNIVDRYITDFPDQDLLKMKNVLAVPHLGASTPEAEENCAIMAAESLKQFLEQGNIFNSVNFPDCNMDLSGNTRIIVANNNVPNMVGQITSLLAKEKINIAEMLNRHKNDYAYNIIDIEGKVPETLIDKINIIEGVVMTRVIS